MAEQASEAQKLKHLEDVRQRRSQVLARYQDFKEAARQRREKLEQARRFQQFRRSADELESWINEKVQIVSEESLKDRTNLQVSNPWRVRSWYRHRPYHLRGWGS